MLLSRCFFRGGGGDVDRGESADRFVLVVLVVLDPLLLVRVLPELVLSYGSGGGAVYIQQGCACTHTISPLLFGFLRRYYE